MKRKIAILAGFIGLVVILILLYFDRSTTLEGNVVFASIQKFDTQLLLLINPNGYVVFFNSFFWVISTYIDMMPPILALIFLTLSFFVERLKKYQFIFFVVIVVYLINSLATNELKDLFSRARPQNFTFGSEYYFGDINPLEINIGHTSFPSGHTSTAFSVMTPMIVYFRPKLLRAGFLIYACLQGFSRMWVGAHFPSDVLIGAIVGSLIGLAVYYIIQTVVAKTTPDVLRLT